MKTPNKTINKQINFGNSHSFNKMQLYMKFFYQMSFAVKLEIN